MWHKRGSFKLLFGNNKDRMVYTVILIFDKWCSWGFYRLIKKTNIVDKNTLKVTI